MQDKLDFGTVEAACAEIGGDKPIHRTTYYRGVKPASSRRRSIRHPASLA